VLERLIDDYQGHPFNIFTLGGGRNHAWWKAKEAPSYDLMLGQWNSVVISQFLRHNMR
jgi:hypothetical protein